MTDLALVDVTNTPPPPDRLGALEAKVRRLDIKVTVLIVLCLPEAVKTTWPWLAALLGG